MCWSTTKSVLLPGLNAGASASKEIWGREKRGTDHESRH